MIILITTRGNGYTLKSLVDGTYGVTTPTFRTTSYESVFGSFFLRRATYIFADLERLAPFELRIAADLYRSMTDAGLKCLNDPARAMSRVEMLTTLEAKGINPFGVFRADMAPKPKRFPVFVRGENDHAAPSATLLPDQAELDKALESLARERVPLRGMLVVEQAAEPYSDGLWSKWGTWRIGGNIIVEHIAVDDTWLVKTGDHAKVTDAVAADENAAVSTNRYESEMRKVFDLASIEFGRADHATYQGRQIVYEININPYSGHFVPDRRPIRKETQLIARGNIAAALDSIDTTRGGWVKIKATPKRRPIRWWRPGFVTPRRP